MVPDGKDDGLYFRLYKKDGVILDYVCFCIDDVREVDFIVVLLVRENDSRRKVGFIDGLPTVSDCPKVALMGINYNIGVGKTLENDILYWQNIRKDKKLKDKV